jgi:hypothetical protein
MRSSSGSSNDAAAGLAVVRLGTPHAGAVGCLRAVMVLAGLFSLGMIVYGVRDSQSGTPLSVVGVSLLLGVALGWFVLSKAGSSAVVVTSSELVLKERSKPERRIAYGDLAGIDKESRTLVQNFGKRKLREEVQFLVLQLRDGTRIEISAPDSWALDRVIGLARPKINAMRARTE